ncbi:MAG: asparagine synthase (glutamine-hydrolyzing) [Lachnospiraceae bacterium]|nr:asparagine synthase (glutamine-hydrolyzing) [Lachnospiraceae bacterium]
MCGIAGFCAPGRDLTAEEGRYKKILDTINQVQKHRGPDEEGTYLSKHCGLAHVRLSILDLAHGQQPMARKKGGEDAVIVYNGEIYNMRELREELEKDGEIFYTTSDTEVIMNGYCRYGKEFFKRLNGIFAIAIWDEGLNELLLVRDRLGVKPLFYAFHENMLYFSSEIKGILVVPGFPAEVDREGLCEIFALGPAKTPGKGVFCGVKEVRAGSVLTLHAGTAALDARKALQEEYYWKLEAKEHTEDFAQTVEHTTWLITDAVRMQMLSDIPISTFLSGGVDSSLVTAICAAELKKEGKILDTFSFDFTENDKYFQSSAYQPSQDRPFAEMMVKRCGTNHHFLECDNTLLADYLSPAVRARDLPCMADVEASMLYFCRQVVQYDKVALTGECADEIFGGYPWFHREELVAKHGFPWSNEFSMRTAMLKDEVLGELNLKEYEAAAYEATMETAPVNYEFSELEQGRQRIGWLNLNWFMVTLLDRMDRTSMASGLEARVPFADHRIVEYIYNVPWEMKCPDGMVKGLLRKAGEAYLPKEVLYRKKSPYPKTYHPGYERILKGRFAQMLSDQSQPIHALLDTKKAKAFMAMPSDYAKPWYGQLMAGPQLYAYLLQVNDWLNAYKIRIKL